LAGSHRAALTQTESLPTSDFKGQKQLQFEAILDLAIHKKEHFWTIAAP